MHMWLGRYLRNITWNMCIAYLFLFSLIDNDRFTNLFSISNVYAKNSQWDFEWLVCFCSLFPQWLIPLNLITFGWRGVKDFPPTLGEFWTDSCRWRLMEYMILELWTIERREFLYIFIQWYYPIYICKTAKCYSKLLISNCN